MSVFDRSQVSADELSEGFGVVVSDEWAWQCWLAEVRATAAVPSVWVDDVLIAEVV